MALALLVTGLSVTELAQAEGFNDFQWSLGEDCAVPLGEDNPDGDGSYQRGDTNDWRPEWVDGTQVPICKAADGELPRIVGSATVDFRLFTNEGVARV